MAYLGFFLVGFIGRYLMEDNYGWDTLVDAVGIGIFIVFLAFILSSIL